MTNLHLPRCPSCKRPNQYKPEPECSNLDHWKYYSKRLDAQNFRKQQIRDTIKSWSKRTYE